MVVGVRRLASDAECRASVSGAAGAGGGAAEAVQARLEQSLFNELMHELRHGPPAARLSARVRAALERMSPAERRALVSRTREGCAPLFEAARRGNTEALEYLVHVCAAPLEQRGVLAGARAPPLWAAAVCGRLPAARALLDAGADVHARSDSASTALRSACFLSREAVARLLLARGADAGARSAAGGTCLINAVQSPSLCRLLLARGAPPDAADARGRTALHHAAREHRADAARLLLEAGADPHRVSLDGEDALLAAAARGAAPVVELLRARGGYAAAREADALELLGASRLEEREDADAALEAWARATRLREEAGAAKATRACAALGGAEEWRTREALAALRADADALRVQALLVAVRVLGERHPDTLQRLMFRGAAYADTQRYERCVQLWSWALRIRIQRDSLLHADTAQALCALTRLLMEMRAGGGAGAEAAASHALELLDTLLRALPGSMAAVGGAGAAAGACWDAALRCCVHAALAARRGARLHAALARLVALDARTGGGEGALHLACTRLTAVHSSFVAEGRGARAFPSPECARRLLAAGADVHATNAARSTPLHLAAVPYNFSNELVETLLAGGAHLDRPNKFGDSALELVPLCRGSRVRVLRHVTLACTAARELARRPLPPRLPRDLRDFVLLHAA